MQLAYGLINAFLRLVSALFFKRVEVVGREHIPAEGPVIFVGNHPNSLLDPVLLTTTCGRRVQFLAKDTLWKKAFLRPMLAALGAIPVRRRVDHEGAPALDNNATFDAVFERLRAGDFVGIFPEGISHANSELAPLKTGAARIALGATRAAQEAGEGTRVRVVPCGLTYHRRTRMRTRVLVQYGPPITIDDVWLTRHASEERETVRALTESIALQLRALTINAPDFETLQVLDTVRRLYTPTDHALTLDQKAEILRRFLDHYAEHREDPRIVALYAEVVDYRTQLEDLGLDDALLRRPLSPIERILVAGKHWLLMFVIAPLAVPGLLIHAPALLMAIVAGDGLTGRRDVRATTKMMVTTLLIGLSYALGIGAVLLTVRPLDVAAWVAATLALVLPLSLWATIRVLERQAALRRGLWTLGIVAALRRAVERLRLRRQELVTKIHAVVDAIIDPSVERIVPTQRPPEQG